MTRTATLRNDSVVIGAIVPVVVSLAILVCFNPTVAIGLVVAGAIGLVALLRPKVFFVLGMLVLLLQRTLSLHVGGGIVDQFDELFVGACVVFFGLQRLLRGERLRGLPGGRLTIAFALVAFIGCVVNAVPLGVSVQGALLILKGFMLAWGVAQVDWTSDDVARIAKAGAVLAVLLIIGAGINFVAPGPWAQLVLGGQEYGGRFGLTPITSFFQHPGYFGSVMAMTFLAALAYQSVFGASKTSMFLIFGSLTSAFLTGRRKVIVGLIAGLAVLGGRLRHLPLLFAAFLTAPALILIFWRNIVEVVQYTWSEYFLNPDAVARVRLTVDSFTVAWESFPFGAGFGRFGSAIARHNYSPLYYELGYDHVWGLGPTPETGRFLTDTFWPAIVGEAGLIGATCFATILVMYVRRFGKLSRHAQGWDRWLGLVGLAWTVQLIIESVAGAVFTAVPTFALFFGLVGIVAARPRPGVNELPTHRRLAGGLDEGYARA